MLKGQKTRNVIGCLFFVLIFCALLYGVNGLLAHKWWYPMFSESPTYQYRELYETDLSDLQAVFLGTSHMEMSIDPMLIYKEKGFVTFNMATSTQPMEGSYYTLEEVFRLSSPKYVFFDVSKLFTSSGNSHHRIILDNMQWGLPKLKYIKNWAMLANEEYRLQRVIRAFFPFVEYHDRWESLTEQDYTNEAGNRNYYRKGYYSRPTTSSADMVTVERMNREAKEKNQKRTRSITIENDNETIWEGIETGTYDLEISAKDQEILMKMLALCQEHGSEFILVKIPSVKLPQKYNGAWTKLRSDIVKELAEQLNVEYFDLLYDYDLGLEWENDTWDNGIHLNYTGAKKATRFFEEYLEQAGLNGISCAAYDKDMEIYDKVCHLAELLAIRDFENYFQTIRGLKNISIFISARDDMRRNLSQRDIDMFKKLGFQTRLEDMQYGDAFAAVIDNGKSIYEELSTVDIEHEGVLSDGTTYQLFSSGFQENDKSIIMINGTDYSFNKRGINIVLYDHESGLVIDSCTFDTWATDNPLTPRNQSSLNELFRNYEEWCMRQGYNLMQ